MPVIVNVPMSAPYKVFIEASIENTYYQYGKAEQVTGAGMRQTVETVISEAAYRALAVPEHEFYTNAQPVVITGRAISNAPRPPLNPRGGEDTGLLSQDNELCP